MSVVALKDNSSKSILILNKKLQPKKSVVFNTYWRFAAERQNVFFKRVKGKSAPWTNDPIIAEYKFTNAYRASDRVSQFLIKEVIYKGNQNPQEVFFRTILFKIFNRISTWKSLEQKVGVPNLKDYSYKKYDKILSEILAQKTPIYSAAYIMASGRSYFGYERKHQNHLKLIEKMLKENVSDKLQQCRSMESAYALLLSYPTVGEFLAYQYVTDINYSNLTNFSEMEFVKAGPGAKDGIAKCFIDFRDYTHEDIVKMMADQQEEEFTKLGLDFKTLWGRKLQLIDCQNIFCEVDKYSRVAHPNVTGISNRVRIKQKYSIEEKAPISFFFPPKWNINHLIK